MANRGRWGGDPWGAVRDGRGQPRGGADLPARALRRRREGDRPSSAGDGGAGGGRGGVCQRRGVLPGQRRGSPPNEPATVLGPLPAGRYGMARATVRHSQRERLLAGALETVAERGCAEEECFLCGNPAGPQRASLAAAGFSCPGRLRLGPLRFPERSQFLGGAGLTPTGQEALTTSCQEEFQVPIGVPCANRSVPKVGAQIRQEDQLDAVWQEALELRGFAGGDLALGERDERADRRVLGRSGQAGGLGTLGAAETQ